MLKVVSGGLFEGVQTHYSLGVGGAKCSYLQIPHPNQIVGGGREGEDPSDTPEAAILGFALARHSLEPSEELFHQLALPLADWITGVPGGAGIDSAAARTVGVLRYLRRGALLPLVCRTKSWVS